MTNTNQATRDDSSERFSLIELDLPGHDRPAAEPAPVAEPTPTSRVAPHDPTTCNCRAFLGPGQALPLAVRGVCPRCSRTRQVPPAAVRQPIPVVAAPASFADVQTTVTAPVGAALAQVQQVQQVTQVSPVVQPAGGRPVDMRAALRASDLVAGAAAEGHGVLLGFSGRGEVKRGQIVAALDEAGLPESWAPSAKSAHAQAGRVVGELNARGLVVRADRTRSVKRTQRDGVAPTWTARWYVARVSSGADVGSTMGAVVLTATLMVDGEFRVEHDEDHAELAADLRARFAAAVNEETYAASDVTDWVRGVMVQHFRAARLGGTWYVRQSMAKPAERLLRVLSSFWGENFLLPGLPVATTDQLREGLADGLVGEVDALMTDFADMVAALEPGKLLSPRAAATMHRRLTALGERCAAFAALLGDDYVRPLRARLVEASEQIQEHTNDVAVRFGLIFDELARDAAR